MNTFRLTVSTPDGSAFEGSAEALFVRGSEGDLAILAGHIPFVTGVKEGVCRIKPDGEAEISAEIKGGLLSVSEGGSAVLLTSSFAKK